MTENEKKLKQLEKLIKNPKTDAKFIPLYQKGIDKLQAKLQTAEPTEVMVETKMPKPRVEKTAPKMAKTTKPKAVERVTKSVKKMGGEKVEIDGVIYDIDSKEFCDYLVEEFKERRANSISKKASKVGKPKTSKVGKPKTSNLIDNLKRGLVFRFETSDDNLLVSQDMFYDADISAIILYTLTETKRGKKSEKETALSEQKAIAIYEMVKANSSYSINEFYE